RKRLPRPQNYRRPTWKTSSALQTQRSSSWLDHLVITEICAAYSSSTSPRLMKRRNWRRRIRQSRQEGWRSRSTLGWFRKGLFHSSVTEKLRPALRPGRQILEGRVVRLEPLDPLVHGDAL